MKTYTLIGLAIFCFYGATAQILFEEGYFIDNSGNKIPCFIRNVDWKNNPSQFRYKLQKDTETKTATIAEIKQFTIPGKISFERHEVAIDRRSYLASAIDANRDPEFREERLFLKLVVAGKASLFAYEEGNLVRFFYSLDNDSPKQLIYTRYKSQGQKILENYYYKSQLAAHMNCDEISSTEINDIAYKEKDLAAYIIKYNSCIGQEYSIFEDRPDKKLFYLSIRPGIDYTSMTVQYYQQNVPDTDFGNQVSFRVGAELELLLPFNKNKWALTFEPFYRSFNAENENDTHAEYQSMVFSIGLRHNFFVDQDSRLFLNGNFGMEFPLGSDIRVAAANTRSNLEVSDSLLDNSWSVGAGFNWRNKLSLEARYILSQDLLRAYQFWSADWSGVSLIAGYTLF